MSTTTAGPAKSAPSAAELPLSTDELLRLYEQMVLIRRFELGGQAVLKKGEMPGFLHLYIGEEATAVGLCAHLRNDDWITSTHRGHGHALAKGVPPHQVMAELYAKVGGCCDGRGGSMHIYAKKYGLFGTNGFVGGGMPGAVGLGLSSRTRGVDQVTVCFFGDGAVNHGAFHESINFAGVQKVPVIFVCENNLYATATPLTMTTLNTDVASKAAAYGVPGVAVDGNDVLAMWEAARVAVERARKGQGPTLIEARTYRTVGHHEGDPLVGTYRTQEELDLWKSRCPIERYKRQLLASGRVTPEDLARVEAAVDKVVEEAIEFSRHAPHPDPARAHDHVWAEPLHPDLPGPDPNAETVVQGYLEAVRDGIAEEMRRDPHTIYMGEGTGERGGSFAHTKNLWHEFGALRMIDTPIAELGFTGAAMGASASGCRAVADLMFVDFAFEAASQIIQQGAKLRVHEQWPAQRAGHRAGQLGHGQMHRPASQRLVSPDLGALPRLDRRRSVEPGRRQGLDENGLPLERSGVDARTEGAVRQQRAGAQGRVLHSVRRGQHCAAGDRPDGCQLRHAGPSLRRGGGKAGRRGNFLRGDRSADDRPLGRRDDRPERGQDRPPAGRRRGVFDVRCGGRNRGGDDGNRFRRARRTGRTHPYRSNRPSLQPGSRRSGDHHHPTDRRRGEGRAGRQADHSSPAARCEIQKRREAGVQAAPAAQAPAQAAGGNNGQSARSATKSGLAVIMPNQDLTITEGKVVGWNKQVGDTVTKGETVAEIETDKAVIAIEAPADGRLVEIVAPVETVVKLGETIGIVEPA